MTFPIRARLALLGALVVAVTVITFSTLMYVSISGSLSQQVDANLAQRNASSSPGGGGGGFSRPAPENQYEQINLATSGDTYVEILDGSGAVRFCTGVLNGKSPTVTPALLQKAGDGLTYATINPSPSVPIRVALRRQVAPDGDVSYVVAGQSLLPVQGQLSSLRLTLGLGTLLALLGASGLSWWLAGRGLRPLDQMAQAAEEIGRTQDLSRRIDEPRTRDEVSSLARNFNVMLERLHDAYSRVEGSLAAQRRFVAAASHELRTPLTTIRTNAEILERHPNADPQVRSEAVADIASESERMYRLVTSLLTLARADSGTALSFAPGVDYAEIARSVVRQARLNYEGREISLDAPESLRLRGADDALRQLIWILVDNAAKHTPSATPVGVRLAASDGTATLEVVDTGPGIPPDDLGRIFDRFYRADPSRSGEGTGLGLSIASWIVAQHDGTIVAANRTGGGAAFTVSLPLAGPS